MKETLKIELGKIALEGDLTLPAHSKGLVIFAHGSGSGRYSPRNQFISQYLNKQSYATYLLDLYARHDPELDPEEFNLKVLAGRLREVTTRLKSLPYLIKLPVGFYGSSTGAAVALVAASLLKDQIHAIVSRGGRTDLANDVLHLVKAPTLLLVGENDPPILDFNLESLSLINAQKALKVIPGASHLFEEPGALEAVALETEAWLEAHLSNSPRLNKSKTPH
ncbi:alpha/beta hydrolase [Algoriphagus lacus]|uniref:Alpha/beta hydrolase n=1 Tax=Algoriphagus lacus TaxID=2056311 RepID=A0A418PUL6_9BACT|nr:alpha/beta hydrolase [Algoriphagus lacus]RIW17203.1 alpha/beta hydrolase [Algoriphagus lacus]